MYFLLKMVIFHCQVSLLEGIYIYVRTYTTSHDRELNDRLINQYNGTGRVEFFFGGLPYVPFLELVCDFLTFRSILEKMMDKPPAVFR